LEFETAEPDRPIGTLLFVLVASSTGTCTCVGTSRKLQYRTGSDLRYFQLVRSFRARAPVHVNNTCIIAAARCEQVWDISTDEIPTARFLMLEPSLNCLNSDLQLSTTVR
jgi:hypothetical protein